MPVLHRLRSRDDGASKNDNVNSFSPTITKLLIALVVILVFGIILVAILFLLRARRTRTKTQSMTTSRDGHSSHHRSLAILMKPFIRGSDARTASGEKDILLERNSIESSATGVPEIRITFPDEEDKAKESRTGRVVVVKISDKGGVGLEPFAGEKLPPYQKSNTEGLQSLDLERIGGLKEAKAINP